MFSKAVKYNQETELKKMLISADDYQRMGAVGIFADKPRVELLDGEIFFKSPPSSTHNGHVDKISMFFTKKCFTRANIRTRGSVRLDEYSEPEPDIAVLHFKENFYNDRQASSKDIHFIIEVAVLSVQTDRTIKKQKYAESGIAEYWIVAPEKEIIEVYRKPKDGDYLEKSTYEKTDEWVFKTFDLTIKGSDLLI